MRLLVFLIVSVVKAGGDGKVNEDGGRTSGVAVGSRGVGRVDAQLRCFWRLKRGWVLISVEGLAGVNLWLLMMGKGLRKALSLIARLDLCVAFSLSAIYLGLLYGLYVPDWQFEMSSETSSVFPKNHSYVYAVKCSLRGDLGPACNSAGMINRYVLGIDHLYKKPVYRNLKDDDEGPLREVQAWTKLNFFRPC
ncbi:hypothetical protein OIU77_028778 [Salix suchowensis]|uniref:Uncharacterized protein n=1 Tax=Salix suchowensis TaxID=1278906 RepID=A0ABQ9BMB5_9ROSI|nr:hypothetical protein OIU77_028778 [Salix suchowensis]